jgi:hypothetical protein
MTIRDARGIAGSDPPEPAFWGQLFAGLPAPVIVADRPGGSSTPQSETLVHRRKTWVDRLFAGQEPATAVEEIVEAEELPEIPSYFYVPPPPPSSPMLTNLIEDRAGVALWSGGITSLKVADIIEETVDTKTFRLVGEKPLLFSYRSGQFVTLLLTIDGEDIERSYSISSSPSRPHVLELTVKRISGGRVSNWLCDHVMLGERLTIKGPAGKFSCFDYPASSCSSAPAAESRR